LVKDQSPVKFRIAALIALSLLGGCRKSGDLLEDQFAVFTVRNGCPLAGIPTGTGEITLFNPAGSTDASAIDVTASFTHLRGTCTDSGSELVSTATFHIVAQRRDASQARQVILPYFDVILQGGEKVVAKQLGQVVLNFPAGAYRASTQAQASARVNRAAATLPESVQREITRERKPGEVEAAIDPLSDPAIRAAVAQASFEHLVGFQMSAEQLRYNATR
jgi:hypothetical protein